MKKYTQVKLSDVREIFSSRKYRTYDTNHIIDELMQALWESADLDRIKAQQYEDKGDIKSGEAFRHVAKVHDSIASDLFDLLNATGYFNRNDED